MYSQRREIAASAATTRPLVAWLLVNVADAILTYVLLGLGGVEGNPWLAAAESSYGPLTMLGMKVTLAAAAGLALATRNRHRMLVLATALMGLVVAYNAIILAYFAVPSMGMPFTF